MRPCFDSMCFFTYVTKRISKHLYPSFGQEITKSWKRYISQHVLSLWLMYDSWLAWNTKKKKKKKGGNALFVFSFWLNSRLSTYILFLPYLVLIQKNIIRFSSYCHILIEYHVANGGSKYYFFLSCVTTLAKSPSCLNFLHVSLT